MFAAQDQPHPTNRPDLRLVGGEGLEPVIGQYLRRHVDPLVFFCGRVVRVVPLPGDHGQVAPLLREQRDAGLVLVLGLLAGPLGPRAPPHREHRLVAASNSCVLHAIAATPYAQVGKFAQLLQTIGRQRMSEVEQQGRRAVLVYY